MVGVSAEAFKILINQYDTVFFVNFLHLAHPLPYLIATEFDLPDF